MDVIAIPRSGKAEHVLQNLEAGKVHLTVEEYARLDALLFRHLGKNIS